MPTWQSPATEFSIANTKLDTSTGWTGSTSLGTRCTAAGQVGLIKHQSQSYGTLGLIVQRHNIVWPPCQLPLMKCGSMQWKCLTCLFKKTLHGRVVSEKVAVFFFHLKNEWPRHDYVFQECPTNDCVLISIEDAVLVDNKRLGDHRAL